MINDKAENYSPDGYDDNLGLDVAMCPSCGGTSEPLGVLDSVVYRACRDCGTLFEEKV